MLPPAGTGVISEAEPAAVFDMLDLQHANSGASSGCSQRILQPLSSAPAGGGSTSSSLFSRTWSMGASSLASITGHSSIKAAGPGPTPQHGQQLGSAGASGGLLGSVPALRRSGSHASASSRAGGRLGCLAA